MENTKDPQKKTGYQCVNSEITLKTGELRTHLKSKSPSRVTHKGNWYIDKENDIFIECYVTADQGRYLSLKGTGRILELKGAGSTALARNLQVQWIQSYLSDGLQKWVCDLQSGNLEKLSGAGNDITPFEASLFVDLCKAYVNAQRSGLFKDKNGHVSPKWARQNQIADKLYMIMSAFAKVGLIAIIDEVTGYQEVRDKLALQKILEKYVSEEAKPWVLTFDLDFYKLIFSLNRWTFDPSSVKRPSVIGHWTNDIYDRLAPGVREELHRVVKRNKHGRPSEQLHRHITYEAHPELVSYLTAVKALMRAAPDWRGFQRLLQRAYPKIGTNLELLLEE
jgi:hypothetical protein